MDAPRNTVDDGERLRDMEMVASNKDGTEVLPWGL
jgi:hypothetical protein